MNSQQNKNNISIKKALDEDIVKIVSIHKSCVLKTNSKFYSKSVIKEWLSQISIKNTREQFKNTKWHVIKLNDKIIGFCQFSPIEKDLYQINISPKYQGKNYGKLLYGFVEKYFRKRRMNEIYLNSTLNAVNFYKNLGFKKIKMIKFKLDKTFVEMVKMKKQLK
ncbi:MAG: GNAT family N-acetyltransferase [Patescibacteria group bacterium]